MGVYSERSNPIAFFADPIKNVKSLCAVVLYWVMYKPVNPLIIPHCLLVRVLTLNGDGSTIMVVLFTNIFEFTVYSQTVSARCMFIWVPRRENGVLVNPELRTMTFCRIVGWDVPVLNMFLIRNMKTFSSFEWLPQHPLM